MNKEVGHFNFNGNLVRAIEIEGEPWFVGKDIAEVLGYKNVRDALGKHVQAKHKTLIPISTSGGVQTMTVINQSGLTCLVYRSKLKTAKEFEDWVFENILKQNKKEGTIMTTTNAVATIENTEVKDFDFCGFKIRALVVDNDPWFVGKDVAEVLGYKDPKGALYKHVLAKNKRGCQMRTPGGMQTMTIINESGLYSLVMDSQLPTAQKFKEWVTEEVLPALRKQGFYATADFMDRVLENPDFMIGLLEAYKVEKNQRKALELETQSQKEQIAIMEPKVDFCDSVLDSKNLITVTLISKDFGKSPQWLNTFLKEQKIQFKQGDTWVLYQKYAKLNYAQTVTHTYEVAPGRTATSQHLCWTHKGRKFIYELLRQFGYLPCSVAAEEVDEDTKKLVTRIVKPKSITPEELEDETIDRYHAKEIKSKDAAELLGISVGTFLKRARQKKFKYQA